MDDADRLDRLEEEVDRIWIVLGRGAQIGPQATDDEEERSRLLVWVGGIAGLLTALGLFLAPIITAIKA